jgi:hypothetical protein
MLSEQANPQIPLHARSLRVSEAMPPRRSARVAAVAERDSSALSPLPPALALAIFALLPVDARLRCREVCRGWRAVLRDRSLWLRLDLSKASGGLARCATDALLRAAAARAGGRLHFLDVSDCEGITPACMLEVLTANAGALRELRAWTANGVGLPGLADVAALLRAAPQLRVFDADVACERVEDAQRLLRNEGAWAPLRLRKLAIFFTNLATEATPTEAAVLSLAADAAAHASLASLSFQRRTAELARCAGRGRGCGAGEPLLCAVTPRLPRLPCLRARAGAPAGRQCAALAPHCQRRCAAPGCGSRNGGRTRAARKPHA